MSTEPALGIDLGGSYCRVAWLDPSSGRAELIAAGEDGAGLPAVVAPGADGLLVGDLAERGLDADPWRGLRYRLVKSALGRPATFGLGDGRVDPIGVAAALIAALKRRAEVHAGRAFTRAVVAYPATYDVIAQDALRRAAADAGFAEVTLVPEPEAGLAAAIRSNGAGGDTVLLCDVGSAATTISVLARGADGSYAPAVPPRVVPAGCDTLDRALYARVLGERPAGAAADPGIPSEVDARLLRRCARLREELTRSDRVTIPDLADGVEIVAERAWLEDAVEDRLDEVRRAAAEAARAASNAGRPVDSVLLIGGGADLPSVARLLRTAAPGTPILVEEPRGAVAVGAAWIGATDGSAAGSTSDPYDTPEFRAFLEEYQRRAAQRRLVILLAGRMGVGKSSTVNSLLGRVVAPINHYEVGTFEVTPYDTEFEGIPFRVVDTPGLCDQPSGPGDNDDHYIRKMRAAVGRIDSLWFVTELFQRRPPGTDELRAIRVLSRAFESGPDVWKCAVIVFTSANSIPRDRYEEAVRIKAEQLRRAIAEHTGAEIAAKIPAVAVENTADTTPDGKEWRGELYTQVCLTVAREGFASWMFATLDVVDRASKSKRPGRDAGPVDSLPQATGREPTGLGFGLTEAQEAAVRERARQDIISSYEERGAAIGGQLGASFGGWLGGVGSTAERTFRDIGSGLGRAAGRLAKFLFG